MPAPTEDADEDDDEEDDDDDEDEEEDAPPHHAAGPPRTSSRERSRVPRGSLLGRGTGTQRRTSGAAGGAGRVLKRSWRNLQFSPTRTRNAYVQQGFSWLTRQPFLVPR